MRRKAKHSVSTQEPLWKVDFEDDKTQLINILNWYNYNKNSSDAKKYFIEFLKKSGEKKDTLDSIVKNANNISTTIGWLCRIKLLNAEKFPNSYDHYITNEKNKILNSSTNVEVQSDDTDKKIVKPTIQENIENQLNEYLSEIAFFIDSLIESNFKKKIDFYEWLKKNNVKHQQTKNIKEYYQNTLLSELKLAKSNKCDQLSEAYNFLDKNQLNKFIKFVENIIDACDRWFDVTKQISLNNKTPRKKKPKSPLKQVEKLQFLKQHESLKSIPPTKIVGASQLWVYNVKYRILGVYVCNNNHGFSVKGCTIMNFDVSESVCKKLRQPEKILDKVLNDGKVSLRKLMPSIRTKEKKLTGRINKDTILLRVL